MAKVDAIKFGKNLRPTTVAAVNKINELITAVNLIDSDSITALQRDVSNLKSTVGTHTTQISTAKSDITSLKSTTSAHTTDIDKIKVTLYTPLSETDSTE